MEAWNIVRCYAIIFCVKLGENATITYAKFWHAFGDDTMSRVKPFHWHKMFSEARTLVEDMQRSRRPSTTWTGDNTAQVKKNLSDPTED
jgi:hypothetical protein